MRYNVRIAVFFNPNVTNGMLQCAEALSKCYEWHVAVCGRHILKLGMACRSMRKAYPEVRNRYTEGQEGLS